MNLQSKKFSTLANINQLKIFHGGLIKPESFAATMRRSTRETIYGRGARSRPYSSISRSLHSAVCLLRLRDRVRCGAGSEGSCQRELSSQSRFFSANRRVLHD